MKCGDTHKNFGMMTNTPAEGEEDGLDIGVFKCGKDARGDPACGFSPFEDAKTRDYTINAVYVHVFNAVLNGPFGALKHLNWGPERPIPFFPCAITYAPEAKWRKILHDDIDSCIRVFKGLTKKRKGKYLYEVPHGKFGLFVPVFSVHGD